MCQLKSCAPLRNERQMKENRGSDLAHCVGKAEGEYRLGPGSLYWKGRRRRIEAQTWLTVLERQKEENRGSDLAYCLVEPVL